ncbi:MAG: hypothetical protein ABIO44_06230 [Saprospiraceae bacterium]
MNKRKTRETVQDSLCGDRNMVIHRSAKIELGKKKDWNAWLGILKE